MFTRGGQIKLAVTTDELFEVDIGLL